MTQHNGQSISLRLRRFEPLLVAVAMLACCMTVWHVHAQELPAAKPADTRKSKVVALYDREPFDVVTLDETNGNARLEVCYFPFPGRKVPNFTAEQKLAVRLLENEDEEYEVLGKNIRKIELYEELLLNEGNRLVSASQALTSSDPKTLFADKQKLLDEAFHHFYKVNLLNPNWPGLKDSIDRFVFLDARNLAGDMRYAEAIAIIEDLYDRNRNFKLSESLPPVSVVMSRLLDQILASYFKEQNYLGMRSILKRMTEKYGNQKPESVDTWVAKLSALAAEKRDAGRDHLSKQRFRDAIAAGKEMLNIWPDVDGGKELSAEIAAAYPIVFVGVTQPALDHDAQQMDNWSARRTGRLVHRTIVEFLGAGPEGGEYQFLLGSIEHGEDRRRMTLRMGPTSGGGGQTPVSGYDVFRRLLNLASREMPDHSPAWASLVQSVSVKNVNTVEVDLMRPHMLPEALLRVPMTPRPANAQPTTDGDGPFRVQSRSGTEVQYANKSFATGGRLAEVVELTYESGQKALSALRRGDIDVIDRLFPADALRIRDDTAADAPLKIEPYALPTVHLLIPNFKNPFLANHDFRRGVLLAINRENILRQELMGGKKCPGFQQISGPFPARSGEADPLGYAYDESTLPVPFNPLLGKAMTILALKQIEDTAKKNGDPVPKMSKFVIGYPSHEVARVACQAISAQLQVIGLETELREFAPGVSVDVKRDCDLVYKEIAIWEPVTDARRILGTDGVAPTQSPYVLQSLRWLDEAQTWSEVRERLIDIHRAVYNDVALLPLWQTVDFFAYHRRLKNLGTRPVWLYQNVDQWRVSPVGSVE